MSSKQLSITNECTGLEFELVGTADDTLRVVYGGDVKFDIVNRAYFSLRVRKESVVLLHA